MRASSAGPIDGLDDRDRHLVGEGERRARPTPRTVEPRATRRVPANGDARGVRSGHGAMLLDAASSSATRSRAGRPRQRPGGDRRARDRRRSSPRPSMRSMQGDGALLAASAEGQGRMSGTIDDIRMQVMWNRLISVVEEQAHDPAAHRLLDLGARSRRPLGRRLRPARPDAGAGGHRHARPRQHHGRSRRCTSWRDIAPREMFEGDTYVTNDPWKGTGHLHDITMVSPSFLDGELVGFFACTAHVVDVGGRGFGADGKSVYEEGIQIPIMKFAERGKVNRDLVHIVRANVREPNQVVGDFYSLAACNDVGHRRLVDMMRRVRAELARRARRLHLLAHRAMRRCERIEALPQRQLVERADDRRLRRAGQARRRARSSAGRRSWRDFAGTRPGEPLGHQCARSSTPRPMPAMR